MSLFDIDAIFVSHLYGYFGIAHIYHNLVLDNDKQSIPIPNIYTTKAIYESIKFIINNLNAAAYEINNTSITSMY